MLLSATLAAGSVAASVWLAFREWRLRKEKRLFSISKQGIRFKGDLQITTWSSLNKNFQIDNQPSSILEPGFSFSRGNEMDVATFRLIAPEIKREIAISHGGVKPEAFKMLVAYYRGDENAEDFEKIKTLESTSIRVTEEETLVNFLPRHWIPFAFMGLYSAAVLTLAVSTAKSRFGHNEPYITIQPDGIILHSESGVRFPIKDVKYGHSEKPVPWGKVKDYMKVTTPGQEYHLPLVNQFFIYKFGYELWKIQAPLIGIRSVHNDKLILHDGSAIPAHDIDYIHKGQRHPGILTITDIELLNKKKSWVTIVKKDGTMVSLLKENVPKDAETFFKKF